MGRGFVCTTNMAECCFYHNKQTQAIERGMKRYMCVICGFIYDESKGLPDEGIPPGTKWDDVPLNWKCPECGAGKEDFEMVEV